MKLDLTSLSFNSNLKEGVGTPSWGTALGQSEGYNITSDGANDLLLGMFNNKINESQLTHNLRGEKEILLAACFKNVTINGTEIDKPFILAIVEEHSQSHDGRKSLKYNDKFSFVDSSITISNEEFYENAQNILGKESCWFAYEFNFINGEELNIKAVIVSDKPAIYVNSKDRKDEWSSLIGLSPVVEVKTEVILRHKVIGQFVFNVLQHLVQLNKFHLLQKYLIRNSDDRFGSLIKDEAKLTSMFWIFNEFPTEEQLSQGGKIRAFNKFSFENDNVMYFLSKEWTDQVGHRLDINNFITIFNSSYSEFQISKIDDEYCLVSILNAFNVKGFHLDCKNAGLIFSPQLIQRFIASLLTKPFVICSGLSGSGKTKLAQAFVQWICESDKQYKIIPVGADWTNREPLLGYPNSLISNHYVKPDSGVLDILLRAHVNFLENGQELRRCRPYFLILDEMNLSHVERYFADFLSTMESGDEIKLYAGGNRYGEFDEMDIPIESTKIPCQILLPKNLFIVGTVNIDETTYMFSPKVLDRANTIEFRVSKEEMGKYLKDAKPLKMDSINAKGKENAESFMQLAARDSIQIDRKKHKDIFLAFFEKLQAVAAEFGYRTANEMTELVAYLIHFGLTDNQAIDFAIMQKLLPKLHGSRSKLSKTLPALMELCEGKYPISMEKLMRMQKGAEENGFASYAEA